ncbi:MAG: FecR domain-containing protein [Dongiaceae bacterium]
MKPMIAITRRVLLQRTAWAISLGLAAGLLGRFGIPGAQAQSPTVGTVSRFVGVVLVVSDGASRPVQNGMALHIGNRIVTGETGRLEIHLADGSVLVVGPATEIALDRFVAPSAANAGDALIEVIAGILRIALDSASSWTRFEVTTRTAVASVRSTEWVVDAKPDTTGVFVIEGRVTVVERGLKGGVILDPGFGTDVKAGEPPTPPKRWGQKRVDDAMARTTFP